MRNWDHGKMVHPRELQQVAALGKQQVPALSVGQAGCCVIGTGDLAILVKLTKRGCAVGPGRRLHRQCAYFASVRT